MLTRLGRSVAVAAAASFVLTGATSARASSATCGPEWARVPSPSPAHQPGDANQLSGVEAISSTDAWAVGWASRFADPAYRTLAEHWDGRRWSVVPTPDTALRNNALAAVSASGPNDVWAVGQQDDGVGDESTLVMHWDGSAWTIDDSATVPGSLGGVIAFSPMDVWATGFVIEHWDGAAWSVQSIGAANYLGDVSGTAHDLWAAGYRTVQPLGPVLTFTMHGDGTGWRRHAAVNPLRGSIDDENTLTGVTVARGDVWSVGYYANFDTGVRAHTLVERWDVAAGRWRRVRAPNPGGTMRDNELWDVEAVSPTDVWAVGTIGDDGSSSNSTLIEHWDGVTWAVTGSGLEGVLLGIAADASSDDAWAVGYTAGSNHQATLVLLACGV